MFKKQDSYIHTLELSSLKILNYKGENNNFIVDKPGRQSP